MLIAVSIIAVLLLAVLIVVVYQWGRGSQQVEVLKDNAKAVTEAKDAEKDVDSASDESVNSRLSKWQR